MKNKHCMCCFQFLNDIFFDARGGNWKKTTLDKLGDTIVELARIKKNGKDIKKVDCQVSSFSIGHCDKCGRKNYTIEVRIEEI